MAFAIIISEKGGAERRELFDKGEISVGRVQGNDLMLPKGNVSKRHAKLTFRDGRFIVTDLKSTNGTYVNGRKITQATIVREGDKIYVGDFVLRFESAPGAVLAPESAATSGVDGASAPMASPREAMPSATGLNEDPSGLSNDPAPVAPMPMNVPGAPRVPGGFGARGPAGTHMMGSSPLAAAVASAQVSNPAPPPAAPSPVVAQTPLPAATAPPPRAAGTISPPVPQSFGGMSQPAAAPAPRASTAPADPRTVTPSHTSESRSSRDAAGQAALRVALASVVERVAEMVDLSTLRQGAPADEVLAHRIDRAVREQVAALRGEGDVPETVDPEALVRDAQRELLAFGPLGALLEDEEVSEVHVSRWDVVHALRARQLVPVEPAFSNEESLRRVVARLAYHSGEMLGANELLVERRLHYGIQMAAALAPISLHGTVLSLRKRRRADAALEELVRSGTVSRGMATFLQQCTLAHANVLVVGPEGAATSVLAALAHAVPEGERSVLLQELEDVVPGPAAVSLLLPDTGAHGEAVARMAARIGADRMFVGSFASHVAAAVLDAIGEGARGVVGASRHPSVRHAIARLVPDVCAARPGVPTDVAREWLAGAFDVVVEVTKLRDGRHRASRACEVMGIENGGIGLRDVFTFSVERTAAGGAVEGTFHPTGIVPRIVEELRARGGSVDLGIYDRNNR